MTKNKKSDPQLQRLQTTIDYQFKQPALLEQALTHKSYSKDNNERLEFIGDAVLGYIVGCMLYRSYPEVQEDALSLMRAQLVRGATLAEIAQKLELSDCLRLGSGEAKSGGRSRASILADAVEAIIGAMHEDGGRVQEGQGAALARGQAAHGRGRFLAWHRSACRDNFGLVII